LEERGAVAESRWRGRGEGALSDCADVVVVARPVEKPVLLTEAVGAD
jgi:hypothetical protein